MSASGLLLSSFFLQLFSISHESVFTEMSSWNLKLKRMLSLATSGVLRIWDPSNILFFCHHEQEREISSKRGYHPIS